MPRASTASERVLVVGRGRAGRALVAALRAGAVSPGGPRPTVSTSAGRSPSRAAIARARTIVLAVPDPAIAAVARAIAPWLADGSIVLHLSGSRGRDELAPCAAAGAATGVLHPLIAMPRGGGRALDGVFVIDGDRRAIAAARRIARAAGGRPLVAAVHGPAYHAAAAMLANGATALAAAASAILRASGIPERAASDALGSLLASAARNVRELGPAGALTGPIARGDAATVARHREALAGLDRGALAAYDAVAPVILALALDAGLAPERARAISAALRARPRPARSRPARSRS